MHTERKHYHIWIHLKNVYYRTNIYGFSSQKYITFSISTKNAGMANGRVEPQSVKIWWKTSWYQFILLTLNISCTWWCIWNKQFTQNKLNHGYDDNPHIHVLWCLIYLVTWVWFPINLRKIRAWKSFHYKANYHGKLLSLSSCKECENNGVEFLIFSRSPIDMNVRKWVEI
jgi:hypothetical protein